MKKEPARKELKKTAARTAILSVLESAPFPISVAAVRSKLKNSKMNEATFYRTMDTLTEKKIVSRFYPGRGEAHYELTARPHHHHITCLHCNKISDTDICFLKNAETKLKKENGFSSIISHTMELFGVCTVCAQK